MNDCFLNGKIVPLDQAFIRIDDIGLLRGYGVFDFLRTYNNKPFLLKEHLKRLRNSAKELSLTIHFSDKKIEAIITDLLKRSVLPEAQVRILLTGGKTKNGMGFAANNPTFAIIIEPLSLPLKKVYTQGGKLITNEHMRHVYNAKTTNYINAITLSNEKQKNKAIEILYTFHEFILECSTSNFFIFKGDTLITPKKNILLGITRNLLLKLAQGQFRIEERDITIDELSSATEAFITATNKEIIPIVQINEKKIGEGKVGKNTKKMMKHFEDFIHNFKSQK